MIEKFRKSSNAYGEDVAFLTDLHKAFGYIPLYVSLRSLIETCA